MEFVIRENGRRLIVYDSFKVYIQHETQNGVKCRCFKRNYLAKAYIDNKMPH